jgi:hypothetical protein
MAENVRPDDIVGALAGLFGKDAQAAANEEKARKHWAPGGDGYKSIYGDPNAVKERQAEEQDLAAKVRELEAQLAEARLQAQQVAVAPLGADDAEDEAENAPEPEQPKREKQEAPAAPRNKGA